MILHFFSKYINNNSVKKIILEHWESSNKKKSETINVFASSLSFPLRVWLFIAKIILIFKKSFVQCLVRNRTYRISRNFSKSKM